MFVGLGESAEIGMRGHSIVRYAKKMTTNCFLTKFKKRQEHIWGFRFDLNAKLTPRGYFPGDSGRWKARDLDPYLSKWMKIIMCPTGGLIFLTQHSVDVDPVERIKDKIFSLEKLCSDIGIDGVNLIRTTNNVINHTGNADRTSNGCTANVRAEQEGITTESIFAMTNIQYGRTETV